jgi:hypothetical protein
MKPAHSIAWLGGRVALMILVATVVALLGAQIGERGGWSALERPGLGDGADGILFEEVSLDVGLDAEHGAFHWGLSPDPVAMMGGGLCWLDYDGDGWLDLFMVNTYAEAEWADWQDAGGLPKSTLFRNEAGRFTDVTAETNTDLELRGLGCVAGDIDGDGDTDLYVTSATSNALLLNEGGSFIEVARLSGVAAYGWQSSAAMGDLDGDGLVDLFVTGYVNLVRPFESSTEGFPRTYEALPDLIFRNIGVGADGVPQFEEVGTTAGLEPTGAAYGLGSVLTDVDSDGDLDIYVANDTDPNQLYLNVSSPGRVGFVESGESSGVDDAFSGMGVTAADLDRNGNLDLAVTNLDYQSHGVFANLGGGLFESIGSSSGISRIEGEYTGWGVIAADFDLDTDIDLLVVNGNVPVMYPEADKQPIQLFQNELSGFTPEATNSGLRAMGPIVGRSAASADYDNDGDIDVAISQIGGRILLLRNKHTGGHALTVTFTTFSPGARAMVALADGTVLVREVDAGSSYLSSEDPRLHFGLGTMTEISSVTVQLPDGEVHTFTDVAADGVLLIP